MTAEEYEHHVADVLAREGWHTEVTPRSGDFGLDVIAQRDGTRLGVQVKKYGGSQRKVNADEVMKLHGAARYRDCDQALLVTDGDCWPAAEAVAAKLQIAIRTIPALDHLEVASTSAPGESGDRRMSFDTIWSTHVEPLRGTTLARSGGRTNQILEVDGGGIVRLTSGRTRQRIPIETLRWAIERALTGVPVTRKEIDARDTGRLSSGVMLILTCLPVFEACEVDGCAAVRLSSDDRQIRR